jgi:UDP-N-acetylglucosamine 1-carboxyvinyltransferase
VDRFVITGPTSLVGTVRIGGAKNAVLPLMAAALLARGVSRIENVPDLQDVRFFMNLLDHLGAHCTLDDGVLTIDTTNALGTEAPYDIVRKMRASVYVLGPLLASHGAARVSLPGGCAWGPRPVNLHSDGMAALGAEVGLDAGYITARCEGRLPGGRFRFEPVSVGATCNVLMAATLATGETELDNCAIEPEVTQLVRALQQAGARIKGTGTRTLVVSGVRELAPIRCAVIADRIETGTFLTAVALAGGRVRCERCQPEHLAAVIDVLRDMGCGIDTRDDAIVVERDGALRGVRVQTTPYPGFPTDMQAQVMAAATLADGVSFLTETIYLDRFTHVAELCRLGADIQVNGATATVSGVAKLQGAPVMATDLRASAALVLAGIAAEGETVVNRVYHIDRGYERMEVRLAALGARIRREGTT